MIDDQADTLHFFRSDSMFLQHATGELALQCGEAKAITLVAFQDELHRAVAESADTIVKNDRVGALIRHD